MIWALSKPWLPIRSAAASATHLLGWAGTLPMGGVIWAQAAVKAIKPAKLKYFNIPILPSVWSECSL
jgi:hypothetical protein